MVDYEAIGRRIAEQRKYFHKVSQEKMAEDLGMYQADSTFRRMIHRVHLICLRFQPIQGRHP